LGVADQEQERETGSDFDSEPRQPAHGRKHAAAWRRRLGARVLPQLSKSPPRLHQGVVERRELGRGREELLICSSVAAVCDRRERNIRRSQTAATGMAYLNDNYLKLQAGYLFPEIARRVREFCAANPEAAQRLIRCGIGDVTEPLPPAVIAAMHHAVDELSVRETFRGYGHEQGL